jgi:hypothetical protein
LVTIIVLVSLALGLGGCRRGTKVKSTPTPAVQATPIQQKLPLIDQGRSPLPTPGGDNSPVQP